MSVLGKVEDALVAMISQDKKDPIVSPINVNISVRGNHEMKEDKINEIAKDVCNQLDYIFGKSFIIHDNDDDKGWTKIKITVCSQEKILEYVKLLEKREQIRQHPAQILKAFNDLLMIADHFNNMFGEGIHNKTKEIQQIEDVFQLMKDITGKSLE